jgi:hypothetical protein
LLLPQPLEQLTPRQHEILQMLAEGQNTKAIALVLKVSDKTVEYHRAKLMARLNIFDIPGTRAVRWYAELSNQPRIRFLPGVATAETCANAGSRHSLRSATSSLT